MSDDGFIPLNPNGFWKHRHPPSRSLLQAAKLFNKIGGRSIVEIGTGIHGKMSGNSMIIWVNETSAEKIVAVDLDQQRLNEVAHALGENQRVELILGNGIEYLMDSAQTINLLYLDFWVEDVAGDLDGTARSEAYKSAYEASRNKMSKHSLILIDDTDHIDPWKQSLIVPAARKDGFIVQYTGRQTLLLR
jgi:predicted O-methyltransferase YrrM